MGYDLGDFKCRYNGNCWLEASCGHIEIWTNTPTTKLVMSLDKDQAVEMIDKIKFGLEYYYGIDTNG